eukprot:9038792-Prorocentrum_lima.AAC.1
MGSQEAGHVPDQGGPRIQEGPQQQRQQLEVQPQAQQLNGAPDQGQQQQQGVAELRGPGAVYPPPGFSR